MIINKNSNQSQGLKLVCFTYVTYFLLYHYLQERANVPSVFVCLYLFVYIYVLLKQL